ncbi:zn-finger domain-containing protein [Gigaspora margarita]|uniref:Zn-finger domain-containing protein n=1 Tax=Gigaspora margarita TaxID=4874 RepID=A0A8H4A0H6_GIGMA|nr:zn-finger domain-containing protein [Gigaspora margarita]
MKEILQENLSKDYSIYNIDNAFWNHQNFNIYSATIPDRMHHLDLGLFKHQIEFTCTLLKNQMGKSILQILDKRLAQIPRVYNLHIFKYGISNISQFTASNYRDMMKIFVFVLDRLIDSNLKLNETISSVFVKWNIMYLWTKHDELSDTDLIIFEKDIHEWANEFKSLFIKYSTSNLKLPKFYSWIYHIISSIKEFGSVNGMTSETYEALHKIYIKRLYNLTNKRDIDKQLLTMTRRQEILYASLQQKKIIQFEHLNFIINKTPWYSLKLYDINYIISQLEFDKLIPQETIQGFEYLQICIEDFLSNIKKDSLNLNIQIEVFKNAKLKSEVIIRASPSYYKAPYYSNIAIKIDNEEQQIYINDNGYCYAKILLIIRLMFYDSQNILQKYELALVNWYNFKYPDTLAKLYITIAHM